MSGTLIQSCSLFFKEKKEKSEMSVWVQKERITVRCHQSMGWSL